MCNYIPLKISARLKTPSMHGDATLFHQYFYGDIPTGKCFMETKSLSNLQVCSIGMVTISTQRCSKDVVDVYVRVKESMCKALQRFTATRKQPIQKAAYHLLQLSSNKTKKRQLSPAFFFYHNRAKTCVAYTAT